MTISNTVRIAPDQIGFAMPADASAMITQTVAELRTVYQDCRNHFSVFI